LDLRDSKWKNAIPFKLKKIHLLGFEGFKMENYNFVRLKITHLGWRDSSGNCVWKNHPRLGLRDPNAGSVQTKVNHLQICNYVQTKNHLFGFERENAILFTNKFTLYCLREFQSKT
jgi:hypothetical protein